MSEENPNKVMITPSFLAALTKASKIHQTLRIVGEAEQLKTKTTNGCLMMIMALDVKVPRDYNVYNLSELIALIKNMGDDDKPYLDFEDENSVYLCSSTRKKRLKMMEIDSDYVTSYPPRDPKADNFDFDVTVTELQFGQILTDASISGLEYVGFFGDGDTIKLVAFSKNDGDELEKNTSEEELGESAVENEFKMFYNLELAEASVLLGEGDLHFHVMASKKSKVDTASGKIFWMAMDINSNYEEVGEV